MLGNFAAGFMLLVLFSLPFVTYKDVRWRHFSKATTWVIAEVNDSQVLFRDEHGKMQLSGFPETRYVANETEGIFRCWDGHFVKISRPAVNHLIIKEMGSNFIKVVNVYGNEKIIKTAPIIQRELTGEAALGGLYNPTLLWRYVDDIRVGTIIKASSGIRG